MEITMKCCEKKIFKEVPKNKIMMKTQEQQHKEIVEKEHNHTTNINLFKVMIK